MSDNIDKELDGEIPPYSLASIAVLVFAVLIFFVNTYHYHVDRWDDAYITFRFARHLASGLGLVWNIGGDRVEGFTSLLHVSLLALGMKANIGPWFGSLIISIGSVLATVGMLLLILRKQLGCVSPFAAAVIGIYLIDAPTAIHTTSGLETQLFVAVICLCYFLALKFVDSPGWRTAVGLGVAVFFSCICRPEAVVYGAGLYFALAVYSVNPGHDSPEAKKTISKLAVSSAVVAISGSLYVIWKLNYFGYILPNPYYVKSNNLSFAGFENVAGFVLHVAKWFAPLFFGGFLLLLSQTPGGSIRAIKEKAAIILSKLGNGRNRAKVLVTLAPPIFALAYYTTIIHEVGGAYRFSYPTFFYLVLACAFFLSIVFDSVRINRLGYLIVVATIVSSFGFLIYGQKSWRLSPEPVSPFNQYHFRIADALKATKIGSEGTVLCDAAGIIPYISGFNQLDRVGLTNNILSGRNSMSTEEREKYIWNQPIDVYVGNEPPAELDKDTREGDSQMASRYVSEILLRRKLKLVESRVFVQDPRLLHARMRELRDNWYLVGEMEWPGWNMWRLKSFIYVRRKSPYSQKLISEFKKVVALDSEHIDLNNIEEK